MSTIDAFAASFSLPQISAGLQGVLDLLEPKRAIGEVLQRVLSARVAEGAVGVRAG